jgi:hypothetical protein
MKTATILVNDLIKNDIVIKRLFGGTSPNIFPGVAGEPIGGKSYPYIRYLSVPVIQPNNMRIRRDVIQYWAGDTNIDNLTKIVERIIYLVDADDSNPNLPVTDSTGTVKVMDLIFYSSGYPVLPSQDLGVWEQMVSCGVIYTFSDRDNLWGAYTRNREITLIDTVLI